MPDVRKTAVLVLNASYEPISFCSGRRALTLIVKEAADIEEHGEGMVHPRYRMPSVIRLRRYQHIPTRMQVVSRKNILLRDRHVCQYCEVKLHPGLLTLDHVIPRAQGGKNTWANLVACCGPCNRRKADRTPEQAGMMLLRKPRAVGIHTARFLMRTMGSDDPKWKRFLYHESDSRFETVLN